jgi:hypothetical protein
MAGPQHPKMFETLDERSRMTTLLTVCQWLYDLPWVVQLEESDNLFPIIESVHVLGIGLMAGTIITVDLRVLGLVFPQEPVRRIAEALLPYTWWGFALMVVSGIPLFAAESVKVIYNPAFRIKLVLLTLAGINAALFHKTVYRTVDSWGSAVTSPFPARVLAGISAVLWFGVIVSGRLIAVFHGH